MAVFDNELRYNVVLTADTSSFVSSVNDAKKDIDKKLSTVDVKSLADGNVQTETFLNDTRKIVDYLDPTRLTEARVGKLFEGLEPFYRQFASSMARAAENFASSAGQINKVIAAGEKVDNKQYNSMVTNAAMVQNYAERLSALEAMSKSKTEQGIIRKVGGAGELAYSTRNIMDVIQKNSPNKTYTTTDMVSSLIGNKSFRKLIGADTLSVPQVRQMAEHAIALSGPQYYIKENAAAKAISNNMYKLAAKRYYATGDVNPTYQDAFLARGIHTGTVTNEKDAVDPKFFTSLNKLITGENRTALKLARQAKLLNVEHGEIGTLNNATMKQVNDFAGLLYREMHDVKLGSPMYPKQLMDSTRMNKEMQELYEIQDMLDEYNSTSKVTPNLLTEAQRRKNASYTATGINVDNVGRMESFVIPRVQYTRQGKFDTVAQHEYAMPTGTHRAAWDVRPTDKSMMYNYSALAAMLGLPETGIQDTYGVRGANGKFRDNKGNPWFGNPEIIAANTSGVFADATGRIPQNKTRDEIIQGSKAAQIRAYNIENGIEYNGERYVIAAMGKESDYWIKETAAKRINDQRKAYGLQPIVGPEAAGYWMNPDSLKDTNKAITNTKRNNSEIVSRAAYGYDPIMNLGTLSTTAGFVAREYLAGRTEGIKDRFDGNIIDGAGIVDPSSSKASFQMRTGFDQVKGVLARLDLAKTIISSYEDSGDAERLIQQGYQKMLDEAWDEKKTGTKKGNQLITKDQYKDASGVLQNYLSGIWLPSLAIENLSQERQTEIYEGLANGRYSAKEAADLREKYFTNILRTRGRHMEDIRADEIFDSQFYAPGKALTPWVVNGEGYEGFLTTKMYKGNMSPTRMKEADFYKMMAATSPNGTYQTLTDVEKQNAERFDQATGEVLLYTKEIERMNQAIQKTSGGVSIMRTTPQFESESFRLPLSVAKAMKLDQSVFEESEALYAERLSQLRDPLYIMQHGLGNAQFDRALEENPNYVYSDTAKRIIQSEINGLISERANQTLLMKRSSGTGLAVPMATEWIKDFLALGNRSIPDTNPLSFLMQEGFYAPGFEEQKAIIGRNPAVLGTFMPLLNFIYDQNKISEWNTKQQQLQKIIKDPTKTAEVKKLQSEMAAIGASGFENNGLNSVMKMVGFDKNVVGLPIQSLFAMNTGDFDGDTVTMYAQLGADFSSVFSGTTAENKKIEAAKVRLEASGKALIDKYNNEVAKTQPKAKPKQSIGEAANEALFNNQNVLSALGTGYGTITKALEYYGDTDDVYEYVQAASEYYDLATSQMMNEGLQAKLPGFLEGIAQDRRLYTRFLRDVGDSATGQDVEGTSIFKHGLRSIKSGHSLMDMISHGTNRRLGIDSGDITKNIRKYVSDQYINDIDAIRDAALYVADIQAGQYTGERLFNSTDVIKQLDTFIEEAYKQIPVDDKIARDRATSEIKNLEALKADIEKNGGRYAFRDTLIDQILGEKDTKITTPGRKKLITKNEEKALRTYQITGERTKDVDTILSRLAGYDSSVGISSKALSFAQILNAENAMEQNENREIVDTAYGELLEKQRARNVLQQEILSNNNASQFRELLRNNHSYSFTNIERYMGKEGTYEMPKLSGVITTDLRTGTQSAAHDESKKLWDEEKQIQREAEELLGVSSIGVDAPLGTMMHAAFARTAEKLASGTKYSAGLYKDTLNELFDELKASYDIDQTGEAAGNTEVGRILRDFNTAYKNDEREIAGTGVTFGDLFSYVRNGLGASKLDASVSDTRLRTKLGNLFGDNPSGVSFGDLLLQNLGFDKDSRVIMSETNLLSEKLNSFVDIGKQGLDAVVQLPEGKKTVARPDWILGRKNANGDEVFDIVDFKSAYTGAVESIYQSYAYVKELEDLSKRAWAGDKDVDEIYKIFMRQDASGALISKFEGGRVIGADVLNETMHAHDYSSAVKDLIWQRVEEAVTRKVAADETNERGLKYLLDPATAIGRYVGEIARERGIDVASARAAEEKKKAVSSGSRRADGTINYDTAEYKEWLSKHDYLLGKYEQDKQLAEEVTQDIGREKYKYSGVGRTPYNRFAKYQRNIGSFMEPEAIAEFRNEYSNLSFAQEDVAKFIKNTDDAYKALDELIETAATEDPRRAMEGLSLFKVGGKESSLNKNLSYINNIVNNAAGVREALKTDAYYGDLGKYNPVTGKFEWDTTAHITPDMSLEENAKEDQRAKKAAANEQKYNSYDSIIAQLEGQRSEMIEWAYDKDARDFTSEVDNLIQAPKSVEEKVGEYYQRQRDNVNKAIVEASTRIEDLGNKLQIDRNADGSFKFDQNGAFSYQLDDNKNIITGIADDKERAAAEANLRAILAQRDRLYGFDNTDQEARDKAFKSQQYNASQMVKYNQFMRQGQQLDRSVLFGGKGFLDRVSARQGQLTSQYENRYVNSLNMIEATQKDLDNMKGQEDTDAYKATAQRLETLQEEAGHAKKRMEALGGSFGYGSAMASTFGESISRVFSHFSRRLFTKALQETTQFIKQYDASMNTIQMITLKSDEQIAKLGDSLIDKAKDLKISVSEITQSAATLYRQGLSDAEVNERLEVVSKFSKVSGTKVDAATKLITVAMNTGLVKQAQEASDIVTALGDNAATNAAEIEKGIEKAGAAAAADGTTFAQLASMLTAITSTTQIGGNVAGRTLNTIFGRMNKIGTNELIYDENGNAVSGSAVAKLLEGEGIRMYDENGNKRSTYETLYALSQKWDSLSDAKQQQFANAIAGTRQYSNFAAIMTGMSEGKVDEYMQLAGESSGITDKKYEIYTKSLNASLTELKDTWDGLVHDMTDSGALGNVLGFFTSAIQGVDNLTKSMDGLGGALIGMLPALMVIGGLKSGSLIGMGVAGAGLIGMGVLSAIGNQKSAEDVWKKQVENDNNANSSINSLIESIKNQGKKGSSRTEDEQRAFENNLQKLSVYADIDYKSLYAAYDEYNKEKSLEQQKTINSVEESARRTNAQNIQKRSAKTSKAIAEDVKKAYENLGSQTSAYNPFFNGILWSQDEDGNFKVNDDVFWQLDQLRNKDMLLGLLNGRIKNADEKWFPALAEMFAEASQFSELVPENFRTNDSSVWLKRIKEMASAGGTAEDIPKPVWEGMLQYYSQNNGVEVINDQYKNDVQKSFENKLTTDLGDIITPEEITKISKKATDEIFDRAAKTGTKVSDNVEEEYNKILGIEPGKPLLSANEMIENIENYIPDNEKQEKVFKNAEIEYITNGYYKDKNGNYFSVDETEKQIDEYNKSLEVQTREIKQYYGSFNGEKIITGTDKNQVKDSFLNTIRTFNNLKDMASKALQESIQISDKDINELRNAITTVGSQEDKQKAAKDAINVFKEWANKLGYEVGDITFDQLATVLNNNDFASLLSINTTPILTNIKETLSQYGINFTGSIYDFVTMTAEEAFKMGSETLTEEYTSPKEQPNRKAIRNIFQGQAQDTYDTWRKKNLSSINATSAIQMINKNGLNTIQSMFDYVNEEGVSLWSILTQDEELAPMLLGLSRDERTGKINAPETLVSDILSRLYSLSSEYATKDLTNPEKVNRVRNAISNVRDNGYYLSYNNMITAQNLAYQEWAKNYEENRKKLIGAKEDIGEGKRYKDETEYQKALSDYTTSHGAYLTQNEWSEKYWKDNLTKYISPQDITLMQGYFGNNLANKLLTPGKELTAFESEYVNNILTNAAYGINGLTKQQQFQGASAIMNMSFNDRKKFLQENPEVAKTFFSGYSDAENLFASLQKHTYSSSYTDKDKEQIEAAEKWIKEETEKYNFDWTNDKNASKLLQNRMTLIEGSEFEKNKLVSGYITQAQEAQNIQYLISEGRDTAENRKLISQFTGLPEKMIAETIKTEEGRKKLALDADKAASAPLDEFLKMLKESGQLMTSGDIKADALRLATEEGIGGLAEMILDAFSDITYDEVSGMFKGEAKEKQEKTAGELFGEIDYESQTYKTRAANWFNANAERIFKESNELVEGGFDGAYTKQGLEAAIDKIATETNVPAEVLSSIYDANMRSIVEGYDKGFLSSDTVSTYFRDIATGGKNKASFFTALRKDLLTDKETGTSFVDSEGNILFDNVPALQQYLKGLQENEDTATAFSLLTSKYPELIELINTTDTTKLDELQEKIRKTFGEDAVDEMLEFSNASKETKEAINDIVSGNTALGLAKINQEMLDATSNLYNINKLKNKNGEFKEGKKYSYKQRKLLASVYGGSAEDYYSMSAADIENIAEYGDEQLLKQKGLDFAAAWQAIEEKYGKQLDISKLTFDEKGRINISNATQGMDAAQIKELEKLFGDANINIEKGYGAYNWKNLAKASGHFVAQTKEEALAKYGQEEGFTDLVGAIEGLAKEGLANFDAEVNLDTSKAVVNESLNNYQEAVKKAQKDNPIMLEAAISVASANGSAVTVGGKAVSSFQSGFESYVKQIEGMTGETMSADAKANAAQQYYWNGKKNPGRSGGGGGGGGNAIQKLLQDQQYEIKAKEHERKMAQIEQTKYNRLNNQDSYFAAINNEKTAIDNLESTQRKHISALEEQLKKAQEGSDEYKKLTEAINTAKEALANYENEIAEVQAKRIQFIQKQQENADKPKSHERTMFETLAEGALSSDRFKDYEAYTTKNIAEISNQIKQNNNQKAQWEQELYNFTEGSDEWLEIRDKIWGIEEETAQLENESVSKTLELNQQRLSQIAKVLQENTQQATHNQKIAGIYEGYYQQAGYRSDYERMIKEEQRANEVLLTENKKAEASARERMNAEKQGTTAYFEAQAAVYQYQEAIAQLEVSQLSLNRALAESKIDKVSEDYTDAVREVSHVNELLQSQAQEYLANNDYTSYTSAMERYLNNIPDILEAEKTALAELQAQYEEGIKSGSLDITMQRRLQDEINSREKAIQDLQIEQAQKKRELDKTNLDWMIENFDRDASNYSHNMNLVQYQATRYQNAGELTNYGNAIRQESALRAENIIRLADEIDKLEQKRIEYQAQYGEGSDLEIEVVEQIKKREEALKSEDVELEKNNKLLEENEQKIRQVRKTLEDAVDKEIEDEKKRQREILSANVSMQDNVLDVIRERYKEEWELQKESLNKQKEQLAKEKELINERFAYRKQAAEQADKDEELSEYRRQLALLEADPTRTKEAKELRRKIEQMEKEQSWNIAEAEVQAENERIDEQTEGYDKYIAYNEQKLNELLSDANNFATEINGLLEGSFEESYQKILDFMAKENESFMKSLPDAQKQMIQNWEDTWKQARDIVDNNFPKISKILKTKDSYLEYMKNTNREYRSLQEVGDTNAMTIKEYEWAEYYDNFLSSIKVDDLLDLHNHDIEYKTSYGLELQEMTVEKLELIYKKLEEYGFDYSSLVKAKDFSTGANWKLNDYAGIGYVAPPTQAQVDAAATETPGGSGGSGSSASKKKYMITVVGGKNSPGAVSSYEIEATSEADAKNQLSQRLETLGYGGATISNITNVDTGENNNTADPINTGVSTSTNQTGSVINPAVTGAVNAVVGSANSNNTSGSSNAGGGTVSDAVNAFVGAVSDAVKNLFGFSEGGLVDFTGPVMVHGSTSKPEAFLSARDTESMRAMLDAFNYVRISPGIYPTSDLLSHGSTSVGDINITINQAELKDDADFDEVAKRVGQAFTKEITKQGLNLSGYAF